MLFAPHKGQTRSPGREYAHGLRTCFFFFSSFAPSKRVKIGATCRGKLQSKLILILILPQGSDPRAATCRGKLQSKRSKMNMEINKELMLRSGAENLFK